MNNEGYKHSNENHNSQFEQQNSNDLANNVNQNFSGFDQQLSQGVNNNIINNSQQNFGTQSNGVNTNNTTFNTNNNQNQNYTEISNDPINKHSEKLGIISLIIGIIAILLSLVLNILIIPLGIIGLVLGILNIKKSGKKKIGIILNSVAIVTSLIMFAIYVLISDDFINMAYNEINYINSDNFIAGKYNCTGVDSNTDKYLITLHLNEDNSFLYGPYGDLDNNHAKGTYTFEDENKTNNGGNYKYFMVTLTGPKENFVQDGVPFDRDFYSKMEMGLTSKNGKKQGVIMFVNSYNMYYCYEQ